MGYIFSRTRTWKFEVIVSFCLENMFMNIPDRQTNSRWLHFGPASNLRILLRIFPLALACLIIILYLRLFKTPWQMSRKWMRFFCTNLDFRTIAQQTLPSKKKYSAFWKWFFWTRPLVLYWELLTDESSVTIVSEFGIWNLRHFQNSRVNVTGQGRWWSTVDLRIDWQKIR